MEFYNLVLILKLINIINISLYRKDKTMRLENGKRV